MRNIILIKIIERFEGSKAFKTNQVTGKMSFNAFDTFQKELNNSEDYDAIVLSARQLEKEELIKIQWLTQDLTIEKIHFFLEKMDIYYSLLDKTPLRCKINVHLATLTSEKKKLSTPWLKDYINALITYIQDKYIVHKDITERGTELYALLHALDDVISNDQELLERTFSIKYFKNSKHVEKNLRTFIAKLIKEFNPDVLKEMNNEEALKYIGIIITSGDLHIKGNIRLDMHDQSINISPLRHGLGLSKNALLDIKSIHTTATRVLSIENKANYLEAIKEDRDDTIYIFSKGYYSKEQCVFLRKIYNCIPGGMYYHSSDLDYGGFHIFKYVQDRIFPNVKTYLMSEEDYYQYVEYGIKLPSEKYKNKLMNMLEQDEYHIFHDVIKAILTEKKTLEQEAFNLVITILPYTIQNIEIEVTKPFKIVSL